jgi:transcriptional regulator with XRE-family HTH domain
MWGSRWNDVDPPRSRLPADLRAEHERSGAKPPALSTEPARAAHGIGAAITIIPMHPGDLLRAVRRTRRLSQRELAKVAGMRPSTIDRIESGKSAAPSLAILERILAATAYQLVVLDNLGHVLKLEDERFAPWDRGRRLYPAHLEIWRVRNMDDPWWGWHHRAFWDKDPNKPDWTFRRGPMRTFPGEEDRRWDEAT